jgi:phospholipase/carboxylesterase
MLWLYLEEPRMPASFQHRFSDLLQEPASTLTYRLRETADHAPRSRLLLLHGVGGNEMSMTSLAASVPGDLEVLLVRAPQTLAPGQFAWFNVRFTPEGPFIDADQAERSRGQLIELIRAVNRQQPLPTIIAGFSQGGILSSSVALSAPAEVIGFGLLSGRILPQLAPHIAPADALANLQAFVAHGLHDTKLPVSWAHKADQWLTELGVRHRTELYPIGHELTADVARNFNEWLRDLTGFAG